MNRRASFLRGFCRASDFGARNKATLNITVKDRENAIAKVGKMSEKVLKLQSKNMGQKTVESESAEKDSNEILELSPELEETLDEMQLDDAQKFKLIQAISTTEQYSGPIPHPKIISGYEEILPGQQIEFCQWQKKNRSIGMIWMTSSTKPIQEIVC